jgi:subtilisin-like proprotein convertase family protein
VGLAIAATGCAAALAAPAAHAVTFVSSTGSVNAGMPNPGGTRIFTDVPAKGKVTDVNVSVRISHQYDPDLLLVLRAPNGAYVTLANSRGGTVQATNNDYGSGAASCSGTQTTFDDAAAGSISTAPAPFNGALTPETPLSALNGSSVKGRWETLLYDTNGIGVGTAAGTLHCATLVVEYKPIKKKKKKKKGRK